MLLLFFHQTDKCQSFVEHGQERRLIGGPYSSFNILRSQSDRFDIEKSINKNSTLVIDRSIDLLRVLLTVVDKQQQ
jgi:hypothetical protein